MSITSTRRPILLAATAAAIALGSAFAVAAPANAAERELSDIENSLVRVYTEYAGYVQYPEDGEWHWSDEITVAATCTGWFASADGHIATAGHCVQPEQGRSMILAQFLADAGRENEWNAALSTWTVEGYEEGSEIARTVEVVQPAGAEDPVIDDWTVAQVIDFQNFEDGDAALLKVAGVSGVEPLTVAVDAPEVGAEVVSIGFPGTVRGVVDDQRLGASFKTGTVSSRQVTDGGVPVTEINAQVSGGMSGGPTIDAAGDVIGINSFGIEGEPQSFNFVTDTDALAQFLTSHGVEFHAGVAEAAGDGSAESGASVDPSAADKAVPPESAPAGESSSDGGSLLLLAIAGIVTIALAGAAVVAVAVVILLGRRRRVTSELGPVAAPTAPVAPDAYASGASHPDYAAPASQPAFAVPTPAGFASTAQAMAATATTDAPPSLLS